jgi:hypothetical protein
VAQYGRAILVAYLLGAVELAALQNLDLDVVVLDHLLEIIEEGLE